jgi:DNA-binding MarR family transcriptional regulator
MPVPSLPGRLRATPVNVVANLLESFMVDWLRQGRIPESATGLSPERLQVLAILAERGPTPVSRLAKQIRVSVPAATRMLASLEELGLVRRGFEPTDARVVYVRATAAGVRWMERGRANRVKSLARQLRKLSTRELGTVRRAMMALRALEERDQP